MSLQDAIPLKIQNGTSSSGVSQTSSGRPWWKKNENEISPEIVLLSPAVSRTTGVESPYDCYLLVPKTNATIANVIPCISQKLITQYWLHEKLPDIRQNISRQFSLLRQRLDNWDKKGSKKPKRVSISSAEGIIDDLLNAVTEYGYLWLTPFISSDEDGDITIEWHKGQHELHIEISGNKAEYIKVWGTNIESDMHLDFLGSNSCVALWEWLLHG